MRTRESATTLMGCESCATRGLVQTVSGYVDPIRGMLLGVWVVCHTPSPEVIVTFCLFEVLHRSSSWGCFLVWGSSL